MMKNTLLTLLSAGDVKKYRAAGHWRDETIFQIAACHAAATPDAPAVRDRSRRLSYAALVRAADRLAQDLHERGVRPGQRVAVWLPSRVDTAIALLACSRNGFVCCPSLHRDHTVGEILSIIERVRAAAVIAQPGYGADAGRHDLFARLAELSYLRHAYALPDGAGLELLASESPATAKIRDDPDAVMYLPFTSGTTGEPKGVMHSDNTLLANARALAGDWNFSSVSKIYTLSPLSHNLGLGALVTALLVGGELVVHDLPRGQSLLDRLVETRASFLFGVPTHAIDLLTELRKRGATRAGAVTGFRISGAAAPAEVIAELLAYGVTPQSGYGMTETCSHQYTRPDDDPNLIEHSCGRAAPGYEVKIWRQDDRDQPAAIGETGEIGGRGASLMLGYFDDQAATEAAFNAHGWFMTGDLGWMDEQGYLRITGRKKDMIVRGGHNIFPARIEGLAMRHDAVDKAAAFPVADARLGERVCLAVTLHADAEVEPDALLRHLDVAGLSRYDMPEYLLFLPALPLTASGKIIKRDLVAGVAEGRLHPIPVRFQAQAAE
jgi:acyl-CoA synthetase (AMP-forming)/AMP-acid ligase II